MQRAIELAASNVDTANGGPFGAVVVMDGIIIGEGANMVTKANDPSAHAEIVAIRNACRNLDTYHLDDCTIYCSCEPCPMCLGAIYWARITKIYYAADSKDAHKANFDDAHLYNEFLIPAKKRKVLARQIMREEANAVFNLWIESENKIPY